MVERKSMQEIIALLEMRDAVDPRIGIYTLATLGIAAAIRRVRPFSRFTKPSDVPRRFIRFRTKLNGTVERIEPSGALLMIQHKPLFHILRTKVDSLPVKISGVNVTSNGLSWLQTVVSGKNVTFIPILKDKKYLECEVMMNKINQGKEKTIYIGPTLVSIGFGKIAPVPKSLTNNGFHLAYLKTLKDAQITADKKRLGYWYYVIIINDSLIKLLKYIFTKTSRLFVSKNTPKIMDKSVESISSDKITKLAEKVQKLEKLDKAEKIATV